MKRDPETNTHLERQLDRLHDQLRDQGVAPERDLWPEIERTIERAESVGSTRRRTPAGWRIAALAACLLLVVGVGMVQFGGLTGGTNGPVAGGEKVGPVAMAEVENESSSMQIVDDALNELNDALAQDPDNAGLSRLILMLHKSRGDLIRNSTRRLFNPGG